MPERAFPTDAGMDLRTREQFCLWPGGHHTFDTGIHIAFDPGTYGKIESKSGLNRDDHIVSCGGVLDEGYTGSIGVTLYNLGKRDKVFHVGEKIAQLVIQRYETPEIELVDELPQTPRGNGGFGSTGRF